MTSQLEENTNKNKLLYLIKKPEFKAFIFILFIAFILRVLLSLKFNTGHYSDLNTFKAWSLEVTKRGIFDFFQPPPKGVWCDYPPLYIYILNFLGSIYSFIDPNFSNWSKSLFTTFIKITPILFDIISAFLIYFTIKKFASEKIAKSIAIIYAFHPAVLYESTFWGQVDSINFVFLLLSVLFMIDRKYALAIFMTCLGILLKPQGVILLPFVLFVTIYNRSFKQFTIGTLASFAFTFLITIPITHSLTDVIPWLWNHYIDQAKLYPFSSIQAFNIWGISGVWLKDTRLLFGISHRIWGIILFSLAYLLAIFYYLKKNKDNEGIALLNTATIIMLAFFFLPTRMHERYLFHGVSFLTISYALNYRLKTPYYLLSTLFFINLLFEFPGDKTNLNAPDLITKLIVLIKTKGITLFGNFFYGYQLLSAILTILFLIIVSTIFKSSLSEFILKRSKESIDLEKTKSKSFYIPPIQKIDLNDWLIVSGLMLASMAFKLFYLRYPEEMIFDEVYHARAAGEYLRGINPYEWVHPPLAKLLISIGVFFFGLNSFGWRLMPAIFGVLFVPVIYVFAKSMFQKRWLGILAVVLLSIDGVFYVQSKTAMTNIFATFFQVTAILFFWLYFQHDNHNESKTKPYIFLLFSGIFSGLAISTRWTSAGAIAFIFGAMIWYKFLFKFNFKDFFEGKFKNIIIKPKFSEIYFWLIVFISYIIIPFCIYIISYTPYLTQDFMTGLNFQDRLVKLWEMQKGIFSYHKNLREPHPYYSEWYTWPFLIRPTWYYFKSTNQAVVSGILALGNPAIWWPSIFVIGYLMYKSIKDKLSHLLYISLAFIILYLPWAVSPRVKNYNHYLFEAIPFACLGIAYLIGKLWEKGNGKLELSKEDKVFNLLSKISLSCLGTYLILVGSIYIWMKTGLKDFPIEALANYSHRIFASFKFVLISFLLVLLYTFYENKKFKSISIMYLALSLLTFIFFFPLFSGYPMYWWYYKLHVWFTTWV